jgi:hypothetical protein
MAVNITQSQNNKLEFLEQTGGRYSEFDLSGIDKVLGNKAKEFISNWKQIVNQKRLVSSGNMESQLAFELDVENASRVLNIYVPYYSKFVDKGVKGVKSSKNAPSSPYQFKTYGMSESGRKSIRDSIAKGKMKVRVSDVKKYGAVGYENKNVKHKGGIIDKQLKQAIYLIKRYGIKKTNFIQPTIDKSFKTLSVDIANEIGRQIAIQIRK